MKRIAFTLLLVAVLGINALGEEKALSVADLNTTSIIGELGKPLHTVHLIECKIVDMSFTGNKADDGRRAFQIIAVDGTPLEGKHYLDLPFPDVDHLAKIGTRYRFWGYETVAASGYPHGAFEMIGEPSFATVGLHFRSKIVILKQLEPKSADPPPSPQLPTDNPFK